MSGPLQQLRRGSAVAVSDMQSGAFNGIDETMTRVPAAGNKRAFTVSFWFYPADPGENGNTCAVPPTSSFNSNNFAIIGAFRNAPTVTVYDGAYTIRLRPNRRAFDNAWSHMVIAIDTDQAVEADRARAWLNGEIFDDWEIGTLVIPPQFTDLPRINDPGFTAHVGQIVSSSYTDGHLAQIAYIDGDGSTMTATDFGQVRSQGNAKWWVPKSDEDVLAVVEAKGGVNSCFLDFQTIGVDASSYGNSYTPVSMNASNLSAHSPENPYAVLDTLDPLTTGTLSNNNLTVAGGNAKITLRPEDDGTVYYYEKDGLAQTTTDPGALVLTAGTYNFGARDFADIGPAIGQKLLRHSDMPQPANQGADYFDALVHIGTGNDVNLLGAGDWTPDLVWAKILSGIGSHRLVDAVRGPGLSLFTDLTQAEASEPTGVEAFITGGVRLGAAGGFNQLTDRYAYWLFREGPHFDIQPFTGDANVSQPVAHSLGGIPEMMIVVLTGAAGERYVYHQALGATQRLLLNDTAAAAVSNVWNDTAPTATHFTVANALNTNGVDGIAYLFRSVPGLCAVGAFTGNGNADGPYVDCGGRPAALLIRRPGFVNNNKMYDTARSRTNPLDDTISANANTAEAPDTTNDIDFVSGGFKIRSADADTNGNGNTIIYLALLDAESGGNLPPLPSGFPTDLDAVTSIVPPSGVTPPDIAHATLETGTATTETAPAKWDGTGPFSPTYKWFRSADGTASVDDTEIAGATAATYTPADPADVGSYLYREDAVSNVAGSASQTSGVLGPFTASTGGPWTPADLPAANRFIHYGAGSVLLDGSAVTDMTDQFSGHTASQNIVASRPMLTQNNGYDVVRFDGVDDHMVTGVLTEAASDWTFFIIGDLRETSFSWRFIVSLNDPTDRFDFLATTTRLAQKGPAVFDGQMHGGDSPTQGWQIISVQHAAEIQVFKNGTVMADTSEGLVTQRAIDHELYIGSSFNPSSNASFDMAELLILRGTLNPTNRHKLEGWAAHKYGQAALLPFGHPYKDSPP